MTVIAQLTGLVKRYGPTTALHTMDLGVHAGEVLGLLGPNGAGKTTTIRLLLGILTPTEGDIAIFGRPPNPADRRRIGYLPGDLALPRGVTGRRLAAFHARLHGSTRPRTEDLAARLDLDLDARVELLSTGNRRKLGIVLAFQHQPDLLVLDEPSAGLDPLAQHGFRDLVADAAGRGAGVLFSSHTIPEVHAVADRVAILQRGRLVTQDATPTAQQLEDAFLALQRQATTTSSGGAS